MRCDWAKNDLAIAYHDEEWGRPTYDDGALFEALTLEGAQAGLSWDTILKKRDGYRNAFAGFDPAAVARFTDDDVERLVKDAAIVRHRGKIVATIGNAQAYLRIVEECASFSEFVWSFVDATPQRLPRVRLGPDVEVTPEATALSKALRGYGMRFVGPTIVYAFMQACGLVNDHAESCDWK